MLFRIAKYLSFALTVVFLASTASFAQKASQLFKSADKAFFNKDYTTAITYYTQGLAKKPSHTKSKFRLGYSYLAIRETEKAIKLLTAVNQTSNLYNPELQLLLAQAHHLHYQFDSAVVYYREFRRYIKRDDYDARDAVAKYIDECRVGKKLLASPVNAILENLGANINSPGHEFAPIITPDENLLVFTSRRSENIGSKPDKNGEPYEDIYFSAKENGEWTPARNIGAPINTDRHDACVAISADGKTMYVYKDTNGGDLYMSKKRGGSWTAPVPLGPAINSKDYEPSMSVSDDGDYIFFSSNRPDGYGGLDIYISIKQPDGSWGDALNLGPVINTAYDEEAPFIHSETNTLYYSSRGPNSMGGYDIFKSEMKELTWGVPENMGIPINTADNDIHYTVPTNQKHAYYSTTRTGGLGKKDIYRVVFPDPEKPVEPEKPVVTAEPEIPSVTMLGRVVNNATGEPLNATIVFTDNSGAEVLTVVSDSLTGQYQAKLRAGQLTGITVKKPGFFSFADQIYLPASKFGELEHNIGLKEIKIGANIILTNIYFQPNLAEIEDEAFPQLDDLYKWLTENPKLRIEIGGHTDNSGDPELNRQLSDKRAKAVYNYLVDRGIEPARLSAKGYGSQRPIADNATEEGRRQNRRTEFTILPN